MFEGSFLVGDVPTIKNDDIFLVGDSLIIDVRTQDEYVGELGHIKGSKLVTLGPELEEYLGTISKNLKVVFVCRSGARSARATQYALSIGFREAYNLQGGMIAWNESGKSVEF